MLQIYAKYSLYISRGISRYLTELDLPPILKQYLLSKTFENSRPNYTLVDNILISFYYGFLEDS